MSEVLQRFYHGKQLSSSRAVVLLSAIEDYGIERYWLLKSVSLLTKNSSDGSVRSIRGQDAQNSWYWVSQVDDILACFL